MEKTISRIVEYAGKIADPISIYVFGSMVNGSHNEHSDLDLLIVTADEQPARQISELVRAYASQYCVPVDVLVCPLSRLEKAIRQPHSFIGTVIGSAKKVYEKE